MELSRVIPVVRFVGNSRKFGSGYLVDDRVVLTASHCVHGEDLAVWLPGGGQRPATVVADGRRLDADSGVDIALLRLATESEGQDPPSAGRPRPRYGRVDRTEAGLVTGCVSVGYPKFQATADEPGRTAQVDGWIPPGSGMEDSAEGRHEGLLTLRAQGTPPRPLPPLPSGETDIGNTPWAGMSGAAVFAGDALVGVVTQVHLPEGDGSLNVVPLQWIDRFPEPDRTEMLTALGLESIDELDLITQGGPPPVPLAELVEADLLAGEDLPLVADLNPYQLGASNSAFGNEVSYAQNDPYVPRTLDADLRDALEPGRLTLLVGPSKAGKTRTAFQAAHQRWPQARLLAPRSAGLARLVTHPRIATTTHPLLVWLDDLDLFLPPNGPLTPSLLARLVARRGPTVVLATLRQERWYDLRSTTGELDRDTRRLLDEVDANHARFELYPTSDDTSEQDAARGAYPTVDLSTFGLAEQLAGAPALLEWYDAARYAQPLMHAVLQTAIDWARVGMARPIPADDLASLAIDCAVAAQTHLEPTAEEMADAVRLAATPAKGAGSVAALKTMRDGSGRVIGYRPFDYLVAADDGQNHHRRLIAASFWDQALARANPEDAYAVSVVAYQRTNITAAFKASRQAADAGHPGGMYNLGILLEERGGDANVAEAEGLYRQAADAGHPGGMYNLGILLAGRGGNANVAEAEVLFGQVAELGDARAMYNRGVLLEERGGDANMAEAEGLYRQAAKLGHAQAMFNLGVLLERRGGDANVAEAEGLYRQAAKLGHAQAMYNLGGILLTAGGGDANVAEAEGLYRQAAEARLPEAMVNLGVLLEERGGDANVAEAEGLYRQAAESGNTDAMFNLGRLEWLGGNVPEAEGLFGQAAKSGHARAMVNLGVLLEQRGTDKARADAEAWYRRAAETSDPLVAPRARAALANLHDTAGPQ